MAFQVGRSKAEQAMNYVRRKNEGRDSMNTLYKQLFAIGHMEPDYGFSKYACLWNPEDENSQKRLIGPLLTSAVLYFTPEKEIRKKAALGKSLERGTDKVALVLAGIAVGDMAGEPYEGCGCLGEYDPKNHPYAYLTKELVRPRAHITDDTILAKAVTEAAVEIKGKAGKKKSYTKDISCISIYEKYLKQYAKQYPNAGYGGAFYSWAVQDMPRGKQYKSYGNGGAMRAGTIGAIFDNIDDVICQAVMSALPTHSHPEGIKGAVVTAVAVYLALHGIWKKTLIDYMEKYYKGRDLTGNEYKVATGLDISRMAARPNAYLSVKTQDTMPEVIINLRNCNSYESCIRNIFRYICDSDTIGAISGGIAAALYPAKFRLLCKKIRPCDGVYRQLTEKIIALSPSK